MFRSCIFGLDTRRSSPIALLALVETVARWSEPAEQLGFGPAVSWVEQGLLRKTGPGPPLLLRFVRHECDTNQEITAVPREKMALRRRPVDFKEPDDIVLVLNQDGSIRRGRETPRSSPGSLLEHEIGDLRSRGELEADATL